MFWLIQDLLKIDFHLNFLKLSSFEMQFTIVVVLCLIAVVYAVEDEEFELVKRDDVSGGGACNNSRNCYNSGDCVTSVCVCGNGYAGTHCEHIRKSKLASFLLAFFLGSWGAHDFYTGRDAEGIGRIFLIVGGVIFFICGIIAGAAIGGCCAIINKYLSFVALVPILIFGIIGKLALLTVFAWWLADWIRILTGDFVDSDGFSLKNDM
jgi:TM2 domain-containing membrane protein YozV